MRRLAHHAEMDDDDEEHGIDLAPMLDFVLNLLIFFIITAIFVKEVGLTLSSPPPNNNAKQNNDDAGTLYIAVHANGDISIDERLHGEKPNGPVIVVANTKSPTGIVVGVMDQVRQGGVMNVSIAPSDAGGTR